MGACRAAYFAKIRDKDAGGAWEEVVLKEFLFPGERRLEKYAAQAENSAVGHFLATEYSKSHRPSKAIDVIKSRILTVSSTSGDVMYNMEEKLEGSSFKRWTNNVGFISEKNRDLLDFSKWSYDISGGYLIFTDIQGMELAREIKLSDPAILCTDKRRFGSTNFDPDVQIPKCYDAAKRGESVWRATEMTSLTVRSDPSLSTLDPLHPFHVGGTVSVTTIPKRSHKENRGIIKLEYFSNFGGGFMGPIVGSGFSGNLTESRSWTCCGMDAYGSEKSCDMGSSEAATRLLKIKTRRDASSNDPLISMMKEQGLF